MKYAVSLALIMCASPALAVKRTAAPVDAVALAIADLNTFSSDEQRFIRYIWLPPWVSNSYAVGSLFLNEVVSRSTQILNPYMLSRNGVHLMRVDLRLYAPDPRDRAELEAVWDALEPVYFTFRTATVDQQFADGSFISSVDGSSFRANVQILQTKGNQCLIKYNKQQVWTDRKFLSGFTTRQVATQGTQVAHMGPQAFLLPQLTDSQVPIIRLDVLIRQGYTSLDTEEYEGLYYRFIGIDKLTINQLFAKVGVSARADNTTRLPILKSGVTGMERIIDYHTGNSVRPHAGSGRLAVTRDLTVAQRGASWLIDLNDFLERAKASEIIYERPNGTHGYAIYNNNVQVDSVPDTAADNWRVPSPNNNILSAGIGCMYCHSDVAGTSGYNRVSNEFKDLMERSPEFAAVIEQEQLLLGASTNQGIAAALARRQGARRVLEDFTGLEDIAAQFYNDDKDWIPQDQANYARAIRRATFRDVKVAAHATIAMQNDYDYRLVSPKVAARDVGFEIEEGEDAAEVFRRIFGEALGYENPIFAALKIKKGIPRGAWEATYPLAAERTAASLMLK